jgi:hypothetical protein
MYTTYAIIYIYICVRTQIYRFSFNYLVFYKTCIFRIIKYIYFNLENKGILLNLTVVFYFEYVSYTSDIYNFLNIKHKTN